MVQLYNPPITQLLRSLLLQCVFLLGIVSMAVAQTYPDPAEYHGPWRASMPTNLTSSGLVADGAEIAPSTTGGSAQFRTTSAYVDIKLNGNGLTGYKVSYSLVATTTRAGSAEMTVSYRTGSDQNFGNEITKEVLKVVTRDSLYLPATATEVRFQLASVTDAYVFLDAVKVSQQPELDDFSPAEGVPGTPVTITGKHLNETSSVFFGAVPAESITVNPEGTSVSTVVPTGAKSAGIRVITPYGEASTAEFKVPAPVFASNSPQFEPTGAGAGETITLYGQYFTGVNEVLFNGEAADASTIELVSDGEITVEVPKGATTGIITVKSPAGEGLSSETFTVYGPQIIAQAEGSEFAPAEGPALTTVVTIYGDYFTAVNEVLFNGVEATTFTVVNDEQITVTVPLGAGTGPITVKSPAGEAVSTAAFNVPAPQFVTYEGDGSQFKPTTAGPNMQITLYGVNLASVSSLVFLGTDGDDSDNATATFAAPTSDTELVVTVPADAKTGKIQLIAPGEKIAISEQIFTFVPAPVIASVANTTARDGRTYGLVGNEVTITGQNFGTAYEVTLGSATLTPTTESNTIGFTVNEEGTGITFHIPEKTASGSVTVKTQGGESTWEGPFDVIYTPTIASFSPAKGPIGQEVTIIGEHLKYVSEVVFLGANGTEEETDVRVALTTPNVSNSEIKIAVPTGAETGLVGVKNPAGTGASADQFEVVRTPAILSFTPAQGIAGTLVAIKGYNFTKEGELTGVTFTGVNGAEVTAAFEVTSDTTLTATVPTGAITGRITASNANGSGESPSDFTITQKPIITRIAPLKGVVGSRVVIEGAEFVGDNIAVTFLGEGTGVVATSINVDSPSKITATVPAGAVTGKLMVTNAAGDSEPSADTYTIVTTPEITSFNPEEGKAGDDVTIKGWLLESVTAVGFNGGVQATTPKYNAADSTITVAVPTNATTGPLTLVVGENTVFTSADAFTVIPAPTIVSFNPTQGVARTAVTIRGTNFDGLSEVVFNEAKVESLTGVEISTVEEDGVTYQEFTVEVPYSATTGAITVTADGGTADSGESEFVVPVPANITFEPTTSYAGQEVVIRGRYFTNATQVSFHGKAISGVTVTDEVEGSQDPARYQLITVAAPFDAGTGPITVTTPAGTGTSFDNYIVTEPIITTISVNEGYAEFTSVTLTGENFTKYFDGTDLADKEPIVRFNGTLAEVEPGYTNESLTVKVPVGANSGSISVESGSGIGYSANFSILLPEITNISLNPAYAGQTVTITGSNFIDIQEVTFKDIPVELVGEPIEAETNGSITFIAPKINDPSQSGTGTLRVRTLTGRSAATNNFTVIKPSITSVTPNRVYAGIGREVTIAGSDFMGYYNTEADAVEQAAPRVRFSGSAVDATVRNSTETQLVAVVPADAITGAITIESGSGIRTQSSVTVIGAPTIASFSTNSGLVGSPLTITGTNLDEATKVTFLGTDAAGDEVTLTEGYTVNAGGTQISLDVPADAITGKISVTTPYGGGEGTTVTSSGIFRVVYPPTIAGFTPDSGPAGSTVRITGTNLWDLFSTGTTPAGALEVYFNRHDGIDIPSVGVIDLRAAVTAYDEVGGTWVDVTVPNNAITGNITVVNRAGNAMSGSTFEVTSPVLVRFEHEGGEIININSSARIKERILLRGYNLEGIGTVQIGNVFARNFFEPSGDATTLEVVVPSGARTNAVSITAAGGNDTSAPERLQIAAPVITVTPAGPLTFRVEAGQISEVKQYTVTGENLAIGENLTVGMFRDDAVNDFYIALDENGTEESWVKALPAIVPDENGNVSRTIYVRSQPAEDANTNQEGRITHSSFDAVTRYMGLNSEVLPLPVELMSFNAALQNNNVLLTWATASEQNNSHFEVEMSRNSKSGFEKIGRVNSKGSNSMTRLDYEFTHRLGNLTGTIYYRLKQVDIDGTTDYSKVVVVNVKAREVMQQVLVAPNPINYNSKLYVSAEVSGKATLVVYSMTGKKVYTKEVELQEGPNEVQLPVYEKLNEGMYILSVELNGQVSQVKLVKE